MTEDDRIALLLRSALPPIDGVTPSRDLWPLVADRIATPVRGSWIDLGLAAGVAAALITFPQWLLPLALHL